MESAKPSHELDHYLPDYKQWLADGEGPSSYMGMPVVAESLDSMDQGSDDK